MDREEVTGALSPEERAYFESGGEADAGAADTGVDTGADDGAGTGAADAGDATKGADQGKTPDGQPKPPKMVQLAALHEERAKRQKLETDLADERKARQTLEQRTNLILERFNQQQQPVQPKAEEPKAPSVEEDPLGYLVHEMNGLKKQLSDNAKPVAELQAQEQRATAVRHLSTAAVALEQEYKKGVPDYDDAVGFVRRVQDAQYEAMGFSPAERQQMIVAQAFNIANRAIQQGQNPADVLYRIAKASGYAQKAPNSDTGAGDGRLSEAERLANLGRAQNENRSLSNVRGSAPRPLTAARLAEMSDSEFLKSLETEEGRALMGQ